MSYNNYVDADAACVPFTTLDEPAVAVIKHNNPAVLLWATPARLTRLLDAHAEGARLRPAVPRTAA